jgi:stage IV sporulation protein FB
MPTPSRGHGTRDGTARGLIALPCSPLAARRMLLLDGEQSRAIVGLFRRTRVFFTDQPRTQYDLNFTLLGIPVRVNPWFWLIAVLLGPIHEKPQFVLSWVAVVFVSILVHEMGHALVIRSFGMRPSILLYSFGGLAMYQPTRHIPTRQIVISLAGPAAGFLLAGLTIALFRLSGVGVGFVFGGPLGLSWKYYLIGDNVPSEMLLRVVDQLLYVNIWWGLVNLVPIWPLDGGQVCYNVLTELRVSDALSRALVVSMVLSGAIAIYSLAKLNEPWLALMFGYLAFNSFRMLQSVSGRGGYGGRW